MANLLIRNVPAKTVEALKKRAKSQKRSLQQELFDLLEKSVDGNDKYKAFELAEKIRKKLAASGRSFLDSAEMIREDRDR